MSEDDKKRDRALQRRVRERQAKTGESYQAAWRQLTDSAAPAADGDPPLTTEIDGLLFTPSLVLPFHLPPVLPQQVARVTARAKEGAININRVFISGAGTEGGAGDWIMNDIEVDGRSQLTLKNLSGALFGTRGIAANQKATTAFSMEGFDTVEHGHELTLVVTYVGSNPAGVPFYGSAIGTRPPQRPTIVPISSKTPIPRLTKTTIVARVQNAPFQIDRIEIDDTAGGAADWIIDDLRINERTQFAQEGSLPGDMFSTSAIDSFVTLEACEAGSTIEIDVNYIGLNEDGARFTARLEGTVVRGNYNEPPPDLHVIVEGDVVIATCNWRAPTIRNAS